MSNDECVLCCSRIFIYAVGACDHPVCYICAVRMRVLCETNECPICRGVMPSVIFTFNIQPYLSIANTFSISDEKYNLVFENKEIKIEFLSLLENKCNIKSCRQDFASFEKLQEHTRRKHELQYCDICVEHLKLFPFERKCYTRVDLARHKRKGDPDDTSHRGHPLCEFCDNRFMDKDELYRHLRRDHFYCCFCDTDGHNLYYTSLNALRSHFRKEHYICEEGECASEEATSVFRTDLDLRAHVAMHHSKNKSKAEAKQAKILDFEFPLVPRGNDASRKGATRVQQQKKREEEEREKATQPPSENLDMQSQQEFPSLSGDKASAPAAPMNKSSLKTAYPAAQIVRNIYSVDDFPALTTNSASTSADHPSCYDRKSNQKAQVNHAPIRTTNKTISMNGTIGDNKPVKSYPLPKKTASDFNSEFPKLAPVKNKLKVGCPAAETTKRADWPAKPDTEITKRAKKPADSDSNITIVETKPEPPQLVQEDQFVVVKTKSKKQKSKAAKNPKNDCDDSDMKSFGLDEDAASEYSYNEEEEKDPFKKNLLNPRLVPPKKPTLNCFHDGWYSEPVSFKSNDFPPLAGPEPSKRPPPGFSKKSKKQTPRSSKPPAPVEEAPAENLSLSSIAQQLMAPKPKVPDTHNQETSGIQKVYFYTRPPNYDFRNSKLIKQVEELCSASRNLFDNFKEASKDFRCNVLAAEEFVIRCLNILGVQGYKVIFPELVCLLPDIGKQQELLSVLSMDLERRKNGALSKYGIPNIYEILSLCDTCKQVLIREDVTYHKSSHTSD